MGGGQVFYEFCDDLYGAAPVQGLVWPVVEQIYRGIEPTLVVHRQIRLLRARLEAEPSRARVPLAAATLRNDHAAHQAAELVSRRIPWLPLPAAPAQG